MTATHHSIVDNINHRFDIVKEYFFLGRSLVVAARKAGTSTVSRILRHTAAHSRKLKDLAGVSGVCDRNKTATSRGIFRRMDYFHRLIVELAIYTGSQTSCYLDFVCGGHRLGYGEFCASRPRVAGCVEVGLNLLRDGHMVHDL